MMKPIAGIAAIWGLTALLEMALVGRLDRQETPVGLAIAVLATAILFAGLNAAQLRYEVAASWVWLPFLVMRNIARDTFIVFGVLLRRLAGGRINDQIQSIAFDGGGDDPRSAARRALAIAGVSTSPNEIVLSVDSASASMRVHILVASCAPKHSERWPL